MEEPEEEGWDQSSCQARCEAGGYARKNMKDCTPVHRASMKTKLHIYGEGSLHYRSVSAIKNNDFFPLLIYMKSAQIINFRP